MPKKRSGEIQDIVQRFVDSLSSLIEADAVSRARHAVLTAFGAAEEPRRGPGRPPSAGGKVVVGRRQRRKGPIQLCPVPGCKNRAAPVFGMVCSTHKDLPKAKIKKYREQRRAKKAK
jgi:hypothetical protein